MSPAMVTIVFPCCTYVSSVMMSSWNFSTSGFNIRFPKTPQNLKKISSDYFHILHIVEFWCDFKMFVGPWSIYIYIKCLWVLLTNVYWFRATGGYICGCGRPSNLVSHLMFTSCFFCMLEILKSAPSLTATG